MLKDILNAFKSPQPEPLRTDDARVALAALMVRVARSDHQYDDSEKSAILSVLSKRYQLDATQAQTVLTDGEELEKLAPDTVRFTRVVKDSIPYEERETLVEELWSIALIDGERDNEESNFLRLVSDLLGVTDRDSAFARQRAQAKIDQ